LGRRRRDIPTMGYENAASRLKNGSSQPEATGVA